MCVSAWPRLTAHIIGVVALAFGSEMPLPATSIWFLLACSVYVLLAGMVSVALNGEDPEPEEASSEKLEPTFDSHIFSEAHGSNSGCPICLEDFRQLEVLAMLPCRHRFHTQCVGGWFQSGGDRCPMRCDPTTGCHRGRRSVSASRRGLVIEHGGCRRRRAVGLMRCFSAFHRRVGQINFALRKVH